MRHLRNLASQFSISLPPDEGGFIGRECPLAECEGSRTLASLRDTLLPKLLSRDWSVTELKN